MKFRLRVFKDGNPAHTRLLTELIPEKPAEGKILNIIREIKGQPAEADHSKPAVFLTDNLFAQCNLVHYDTADDIIEPKKDEGQDAGDNGHQAAGEAQDDTVSRQLYENGYKDGWADMRALFVTEADRQGVPQVPEVIPPTRLT